MLFAEPIPFAAVQSSPGQRVRRISDVHPVATVPGVFAPTALASGRYVAATAPDHGTCCFPPYCRACSAPGARSVMTNVDEPTALASRALRALVSGRYRPGTGRDHGSCLKPGTAPRPPWSVMSTGLDAATRLPSSRLSPLAPSRAVRRLRAWHAACGEEEHAARQALRLIPRASTWLVMRTSIARFPYAVCHGRCGRREHLPRQPLRDRPRNPGR